MKLRGWFGYALAATVFWGTWGAFIEIPEKTGFPATLGYCVWALTMIVPAFFALRANQWKLDTDKRSVLLGLLIGLLGSVGQLVLFHVLVIGPAYLVFPLVSLSPLLTILMSYFVLKERTSWRAWSGIVIALIAIPLLSYQPPSSDARGFAWIPLGCLVFVAWGLQAYCMKVANNRMQSASIFFYMMISGIALIPVALTMTDFENEINWGFTGPYLATVIQLLNSIGALFLVYAFRYGKAIIVSPMVNAGAPILTVVLSLIIYSTMPHWIILSGMLLAVVAIFLMAE